MSESLWDFSVRTYRGEWVSAACLALQDERGVDVNMLLYCCWHGATRGAGGTFFRRCGADRIVGD